MCQPFNNIINELMTYGWCCIVDAYAQGYAPACIEASNYVIGTAIVDLLVSLKMSSSKPESVRLIKARAVAVDGVVVIDHAATLNAPARAIVISRGRRLRKAINVIA